MINLLDTAQVHTQQGALSDSATELVVQKIGVTARPVPPFVATSMQGGLITHQSESVLVTAIQDNGSTETWTVQRSYGDAPAKAHDAGTEWMPGTVTARDMYSDLGAFAWPVGRYKLNGRDASGVWITAADRTAGAPRYIPYTLQIDAVRIEVTTTGNGPAHVRFARMNTGYEPYGPWIDAGVDLPTSSAGFVQAELPEPVTLDRGWWLVAIRTTDGGRFRAVLPDHAGPMDDMVIGWQSTSANASTTNLNLSSTASAAVWIRRGA